MILNDLFESGMSRILDTMREVKTLSDDEFIKAHDMSKHMWVRTNWPVIKSVASYDSEIKKHLRKPIGDEHLFHGTAVSPTVHEGSQTFGKHDPYWVCVNGKKWKRFDTYEHARAVHDRLEKKLRSEGSDKKVSLLADDQLDEKQDACYNKVKSRYKVWPSAYASGALVQCRKKGAANWGNKSKK